MIAPVLSGALIAWLGIALPLAGQSAAHGVASLRVNVIDSISGSPVFRIVLWNWRSTGPRQSSLYYVKADTTGELRLDSIPAGVPQRFQVVCEHFSMWTKQLDSLTLTLTAGEVRERQVRTSSSGCDQRPFVTRRGVFQGRWRYGFEESRFVACDSPAWEDIWVHFPPTAEEAPGLRWPKDLTEVFVRFEGQLVGPWRYGHLGVADFQLTVYRVLEVRKPSSDGCGR